MSMTQNKFSIPDHATLTTTQHLARTYAFTPILATQSLFPIVLRLTSDDVNETPEQHVPSYSMSLVCLHDKYRSHDGNLYLIYCLENTFGEDSLLDNENE